MGPCQIMIIKNVLFVGFIWLNVHTVLPITLQVNQIFNFNTKACIKVNIILLPELTCHKNRYYHK